MVRNGQEAAPMLVVAAGTAPAGNPWLMLPPRMLGTAQQAGAKKLVLTHIVAPEVDETATVNAIAEVYRGKIIVGHDLKEIVPEDR